MIPLHELRINNRILENGEPSWVYSLDRGGISFYRINDIPVNKETGCTLNGGEDRFKPIALTAEVLQACGFAAVHPTMMPGYSFYRSKSWDERHRFRWESLDGFAIETVGSGWIWRFREIKYIHQVQNLFYWVSGGIELPINLEQVTP